MKEKLIAFLILLIAIIILGVFVFFYDNFRGVLLLLKEPQNNAVNSTSAPAKTTSRQGENKTDFPLVLPAGFSISVFDKDLPNARVIVQDGLGNFLVSQPSQGIISLLEVKDGQVTGHYPIFKNLNRPHGLAIDPEDGLKLYIAESDKISFIRLYAEDMLHKIADLPDGGEHFTRTIGFGPDDKLYVSIGSDCNACVESDSRRAKIFRLDKDGGNLEELASGLRNAVFFTWSRADNGMWATEMGRDYLSDNLPPDEINLIQPGKNYGWPYCYGKQIADDTFTPSGTEKISCLATEPSIVDIPAHSAPLGLAFTPVNGWPADYANNLIVAYHGSWNRSVPTGYKVVRVKLDENGNYQGSQDFITGWLADNGGSFGRPVDVLIQPDGTMYLTDDKAGLVYQIIYREN